jgi:predicted acyltransferase
MQDRYPSLDVFRGATVALMILVNNPGSWTHIYSPLAHASWHGATPTDLVFPFFLFAVGNALAFVMPRLEQAGPMVFRKKVLRRTLLIFGIGLLLNAFPFVRYDAYGQLVMKQWENLRIMGVLQRIALCYLLASVFAWRWKERGSLLTGGFLLLGYWILCLGLGTPGDPFSLEGYFGNTIDRAVLGESHLYKGEGVPFDPEGLMSTLPAAVNTLFGYLTGAYIIRKGRNWEMLSNLYAAGLILIFAGLSWGTLFPINKKIWTSSYVLYTVGLAMCVLGIFIHLLEFRKAEGAWSRFFLVFGRNPLFIFVLSGVVAKTYGLFRIEDGMKDGKPIFRGLGSWMYEHIFVPAFGQINGSLLYAIAHILVFWLICRWLDQRKIYIRV